MGQGEWFCTIFQGVGRIGAAWSNLSGEGSGLFNGLGSSNLPRGGGGCGSIGSVWSSCLRGEGGVGSICCVRSDFRGGVGSVKC